MPATNLFFCIVATLLIATGANITQRAGTDSTTRVAVQVVNPGAQYYVDPMYVSRVNARFPDLANTILSSTGLPVGETISSSSVISIAKMYRISTGSEGEVLGTFETFLGPSASFALLRFERNYAAGNNLFGEVLLVAGQRPNNKFQIAKFTSGTGTVTSLNGVTGILSINASGDIVGATDSFKPMMGGQASLSGVISIDALSIAPGVNSTSDFLVLLKYQNRGGGWYFSW